MTRSRVLTIGTLTATLTVVSVALASSTITLTGAQSSALETNELFHFQPYAADAGYPPVTAQVDTTPAYGWNDDVLRIGHNVADQVPERMRSMMTLEAAYVASPGASRQAETHWEFISGGASAWTGSYRPLSASCVEVNGQMVMLLQFADGTDGAAGSVQITEQRSGALQASWETGRMQLQPVDYELRFVSSGKVTSGGALVESFTSTMLQVALPETITGAVTEPATPASGTFVRYIDSADGALKVKGSAGTVTVLAVP